MNELVSEVQAKIGTLQDNNHLLQIEKDKAMADLITLRKNMKEKERCTCIVHTCNYEKCAFTLLKVSILFKHTIL